MQHLLFRSLFDLLEIFEQIQLKSELAKDIEKQRLSYRSWLHGRCESKNAQQRVIEVDEV